MKKSVVFGTVAAAMVSVSFADEYVLSEGQSDTLATAATYDKMSIAGALTIQGVNINCDNICVTGGSVRVTGKGGNIGNANAGTSKWYVTNDVNGVTTTFLADNSGQIQFGELFLRADSDLIASRPGYDGTIPFLTISNSAVQTRFLYNYTAATARVDVVGNSEIIRPGGWNSDGAFNKGAFLVTLKDGATLTFNAGNQMGTIAADSVPWYLQGTGDFKIDACNGDKSVYRYQFRKGTVLNNIGKVTFHNALYDVFNCEFLSGELFGTNVTEWTAYASDVTRICRCMVGKDVELRVPQKTTLAPKDAILMGEGTYLLDATDGAIEFEGSMTADPEAVTYLRKIGGYEATIASTNLINVKLEGGTTRFVKYDCVIRDLTMHDEAQIVVDGCTLTLACPEAPYGSKIKTVNGGKVRFSGTSYLYNPQLEGKVHVADGNLVCSAGGITNKYLRFTFSSVAGKDRYFARVRGMYLFSNNHCWENYSMGSAATVGANENTPLDQFGENTIRYYTSSATNVALLAGSQYWQALGNVYLLTKHTGNGNNGPNLASPVIDPNNPDSWLSIDVHLKNTANPINSYNLANEVINVGGVFGSVYPNVWKVYASDDGSNWTEIDSRSDVVCRRINSRNYYYYYSYDGTEILGRTNAGEYQALTRENFTKLIPEYFHFSGYKRDGLSAVAPISVQVDAGASLDLTSYTEVAQSISGIDVEASLGGGKIKGGTLAAAGVVTINMAGCTSSLMEVPFEFESTGNLSALANWQVAVFGKVLPGVTVSYNPTAKKLVLSANLQVYDESGEVDLAQDAGQGHIVVYVNEGVDITNTEVIEGEGRALMKFGPGSLTLTETSTYGGGTYIDEGVVTAGVTNGFGTGAVTLKCGGNNPCQVVLGSKDQGATYDNDFVLENDSTPTYKAIHFITAGIKPIVLNGSITANGNLYMYGDRKDACQGKEVVRFNSFVSAPGKIVDYPTDNSTYWMGPITAAAFRARAGYPDMGGHFFANCSNSIGVISWAYNSIYAVNTNVLGGAVLNFYGGDTESGSRNGLRMQGYDQTVAYLYNDRLDLNKRQIDPAFSAIPAETLTLTGGVACAVAAVKLGDSYYNNWPYCSMVVDAGNDDFVQVFTNSEWLTFGSLTVKNGTVRFAGNTTMTNMPTLTVTGGALEFDMVSTGACQNVSRVDVGAGGRFMVGTGVSELFNAADKKTVLSIASTSQIDLPAGAEFTVNHLKIDGERLVKGVYTGVQGAEGTMYLPQINGSGRLTVLKGGGLVLLLK